nr:MAG TPA: hypothetical protein [Caudoviricetes sp.]
MVTGLILFTEKARRKPNRYSIMSLRISFRIWKVRVSFEIAL